MKCEQVREGLLDVATGAAARPEVEQHMRECGACRAKAEELRGTMALLGEWRDVNPSPYFDTRLQARRREQAAAPGLWAWLRKPALAGVFVLLIAAGVGLFQRTRPIPAENVAQATRAQSVTLKKVGTAVSDLQALDRNEDLYANFEVLDDVPTPQESASAQ